MGAYFKVFKDAAGEFRFNLHAPNGERILHSEGYSQKAGCINGIESVRTHSTSRTNFDEFVDAAGKYRFRLRAKNYEIIGHSEAYETAQSRQVGIESVMRNAPIATIIDDTI
jgi:hypothetical protein